MLYFILFLFPESDCQLLTKLPKVKCLRNNKREGMATQSLTALGCLLVPRAFVLYVPEIHGYDVTFYDCIMWKWEDIQHNQTWPQRLGELLDETTKQK